MKMTKEDIESRSQAFIKDVNKELAPVLRVVMFEKSSLGISHNYQWQVLLCDTKYARVDEVSPDGNKELLNLIKYKSVKHFEQQANFNNSGTIFWVIVEAEEE